MNTDEKRQQQRGKRQAKKAKARIAAKKAAYTRATKVMPEGLAAALTRNLPGVKDIVWDGNPTGTVVQATTKALREWFNLGVDTYNRGLRLRKVIYHNLRKLAAQGDTDAARALQQEFFRFLSEADRLNVSDVETRRRRVPKARNAIYLPVGRKGPVPIGEALSWTPTYDEVTKWDESALHTKAMKATRFQTFEWSFLPRMTYSDCLLGYCQSKWGRDHGHDVCSNVLTDVLCIAHRDLRRKEYRLSAVQYDRRRVHRSANGRGRFVLAQPEMENGRSPLV